MLDDVGSPLEHWLEGELKTPPLKDGVFDVPLVAADSFGNLLTNLHARSIMENPAIFLESGDSFLSTYGESNDGSLIAILGSDGYLELAVKNGSAAEALGSNWRQCRLTVASKC